MRVVYPNDFQTKVAYDAAGDKEQGWLQTTTTGPGTLTFYWSVNAWETGGQPGTASD